MASPISSALAKLDGSLQALQVQVDSLRAGLEINDSQLNYSLADTSQNAAMVRDLIRAERPDAAWGDRGSLERLIRDLEVAAQQRRNEQRRMRLLDLADEFEAGSIRHRSESRTASLNGLRIDAIQQLRTDAAVPEQQKELPGPEASEWLHWACNLSEDHDAPTLNCLRMDFSAVDHFAGEMEESYWTPGERVRRPSVQPSSPPPRRPEPPTYASKPPSPPSGGDYGKPPSYNVGSRPDPNPQNSNYAAAVARAYDRPSGGSPALASHSQMSSVAVAPEPEVQAPPATKYCDKCGTSYTDAYHVCPVPEPAPRPVVAAAPAVTPRPSYPVADKPKVGGNGASSGAAIPIQAAAPVVAAPAPAPVVAKPVQAPKVEPKPAAKAAEKAPDNKKTRKEKRRAAAEAAAAAAAVTVTTAAVKPATAPAPTPVEVARPKAATAPAPAKVASDSAQESWMTKWQTLQSDGGEALKDGNWSKYAFAPESLAVVALLLVVAIGGIMWKSHKSSGTAPATTTVAQNSAPAQTPASAPSTTNPQSATPTNAATQTKPSETQSKQQDQNASKNNQDNPQQKEVVPPPAQVLSPPPEAPKTSTPVTKEEASSGDVAPPSLNVASGSPNGMGNIVKDLSASVPKLANQKLRVSSGVAQGQLLARVNPQYPTAARQERVEGTVVLQAVIDKDGSVKKLTVVSGPNMLTKAAMDAVRQWRYKPFTLNGESVEADTQINVNFKLGE